MSQEDKSLPSGINKVLAIRVKYTNWDPDTLCTADCLAANLWTGSRSVDGVYREASRGMMSIPQEYGQIVTVSLPVASTSYSNCNDLTSIAAAAEAALASQYPSIVLSSFSSRLYFTNAICGIGVAFLGSTPGKLYVNSAYPDTIAHELGHTLGMQHSNRDPGDDNYVDESYGDRSCIMGYSQLSLRSFNVIHRIESGWIPSNNIMDLANGCSQTPQTITLSPVSMAGSSDAIVAIRTIRRKLGRYYIAFRNTDGYDGLQASTYANKVHIEYQIATGGQTQLVAVLSAGQTWSQADGDLTVTVSAIASTGATLAVTYCRPSTFTGVAGTLTCGATVTGSNVGASNLAGYTSGDVFYQVSLTAGTTYSFSTCGSSMDTVLRVFSDGLYQQVTMCDNCGTCAANEYAAVITGFAATTGKYIIGVEGFNTATGSFVLSMGCASSAVPSSSPMPSPSSSPSPSKKPPTPSSSPSRSPSRSPSPSPSRSKSVSTM
jgi:hypothetical protein